MYWEDGIKIDEGFKTYNEAVTSAFCYWRYKYADTITTSDKVLDKYSVKKQHDKLLEEGFAFYEEEVK
jgi:hypothetical protein